jgi:hypothetical protein
MLAFISGYDSQTRKSELGAAGNRATPLPLSLLSSKGNYDSWASRTRPVPVRFNYGPGAQKTRIATTSRNGC